MKKIMAVMLCLLILLCAGCAKKPVETQAPTDATVEPTAAPNTEAPETQAPETEPVETEPPAPETEAATSLVDHAVVIQAFLERGAAVDVVGEYDDTYYVVKTDAGYGLIEKLIVRLEGEPAYESWNGYARGASKLFDNYHLLPGNTMELNMNRKVQVLECFEDICLVQLEDGTTGYMLLSQISRTFIVYTPSNQDGGDISLGLVGGVNQLSSFVAQEGDVTGTGTVLVDAAEVILGWFDRGEAMSVVTDAAFAPAMENYVVVYQDGLWGYVNAGLVAAEGVEPYEEWTGYAKSKAGFYDNFYLSGAPVQELNANTQVKVVADLGDVYLVYVNDVMGYMAKDQVSTTRIVFNNQGGGEWSDPVM